MEKGEKKCSGVVSKHLAELKSQAEEVQACYDHALDFRTFYKRLEVAKDFNNAVDHYWDIYRALIETGILQYEKITAENLMKFIAEQSLGDPQLLADFAYEFGLGISFQRFHSR